MTAADFHVERRAAPDPRAEAGSVATAAVTHLVRLARPARGAARRMARVVGRAPATSAGLIGLVGLLVQTVGYAAGWSGDTDRAIVLFYVGLVVLLTPYAVLLLSPLPAPRSRVVAVVSFGLLMYASWLAASPVYAAAFDETLHVTTLGTMTDGGGWFAPNTMLPVSPHYPGLELATSAVHWGTGLPLMACQIVVVALARTVLVLGLYLLGSRLTGSARGGGIVVLLYAASPQFWFFNAQFSYQTVALALLVGSVVFLLRAFQSTPDTTLRDRSGAWWPMLGVLVCLAALAITHHITSWLTVGALWLVALVLAAFGEPRRARLAAVSAQLGLLVVVAWSALVAPLLARYLGPVAGEAGTEIVRLIRSDGGQHAALSENPANAAPLWETGVMGLAVLLWIALLLPSLRAAVAGRSLGRSPARFVLAALAAAFPLLFAVRFSPSAGEIADRASTFVTLGVVLVGTAWLAASRFAVLRRIRLRVAVPAALVLLVGGLILGSGPDWQRTPGPFLAGAEQRSVDSHTLAVADWSARYLPADSRIAADVTLDRVLPTVAPVVPVTGSAGSVNVTPLFINETLDLEARQLLVRGKVDFVFVDRRLEGETVHSGGNFEGTDWGPGRAHPHRRAARQVRGRARLPARARRPGAGLRRPLAAGRAAGVHRPGVARTTRRLATRPGRGHRRRGAAGDPVPAHPAPPRPVAPGARASVAGVAAGPRRRRRTRGHRRHDDGRRRGARPPGRRRRGRRAGARQRAPAGLVAPAARGGRRRGAARRHRLAVRLECLGRSLRRHRAAAAPHCPGRVVTAVTAPNPVDRADTRRGLWAPFASLLSGQSAAALLGLVFWLVAARVVDPAELGVAAAAISTQTLLGLLVSLGLGTHLVTELPGAGRDVVRRWVHRALLGAGAVGVVVAGVLVAVVEGARAALDSDVGGALAEGLSHPLLIVGFVLGVVAATGVVVLDEAVLGLRRSRVQLTRNVTASLLRFPVGAALLFLAGADAWVVQAAWVLPLLVSLLLALRALRLPASPHTPWSDDVQEHLRPALRHHAVNLAVAASTQVVPVIAGITLAATANAQFAVAWLLATCAYLPPYLLATALYAHASHDGPDSIDAGAALAGHLRRTVPVGIGLVLVAWVAVIVPRRARPGPARRHLLRRLRRPAGAARAGRTVDGRQGPPRRGVAA